MNVAFFDTETTGLVNDNISPVDPRQPMPIQLGIKVDAANRREMAAMNFLIQRDGWEMHPKAMEITGLTNEMADEFGMHLVPAVEAFCDLIEPADVIVAHNTPFDVTVMRRATYVYSEWVGTEYKDPFEGKQLICTMRACTDIVKAKPKRNGKWKWPKLVECTRYFWNEDIEGAHDALTDVRACARVFYNLLDEGHFS